MKMRQKALWIVLLMLIMAWIIDGIEERRQLKIQEKRRRYIKQTTRDFMERAKRTEKANLEWLNQQ